MQYMRTILAVFGVAIVLASCASDTVVAPSTGTIVGVVRYPTTMLPQANVQISTLPPTQSLITDGDGSFTIDDVTPGTYVVNAMYVDSAYATTAVSVKAGSSSRADIILSIGTPTKGIITGVVMDEAGKRIKSVPIRTSPVTSTATSNDNGEFTIINVEPGTYEVYAMTDSLIGTTFATVTAGGIARTTIVARPQSPNTGWITGSITRNDKPVQGAVLTIASITRSDTTTADGSYAFYGVPPGSYTMAIVVAGTVVHSVRVDVTVGSGRRMDVDLSRIVTIPTEGLMLYLPFNGAVADLSPARRPTTVLGGQLTTDRLGNSDGAFMNDGSISGGIEIPHSQDLNMFSMTMGAWLYIDEQSLADCLLLGKNVHPLGDGYYFMMEKGRLALVYTARNFAAALRRDFDIPTNRWFWAGMSISNDGSGIAVVDGVSAGMQEFGAPETMRNIASFRVGSTNTALPDLRGLNGKIDKVVLYDRSMSIEELTQIMERAD